ncbi:prolyl endopeptidase-like protein [Gamsiella multidivaricata]|uniref:prolyl endopeptidase-like protein n=1 Tax=Gamsiella multidivaricata TaxID=101098 RepID=UPI00222017B4|nr:prolyl endopeptidase-like protein [Gamsiella multidivaricata]KAG0358405.1 hypothetical protein BGZ54_010416 [Gamsiella multidivaricata]KAI7831237.1 prolyl endopeptidase-like protein [Gamsiella multidivaricata]
MLTTEPELITSLDGKIVYPQVRRSDFAETLHGTTVADPYRWLENPDSKETKDFVEAQAAFGNEFMNKFDAKQKFNERLTALYNYERYSTPFKRGDYYYYRYNSGLQAQSVLYQQDSLDSKARVFLDVNTLEADGTAALGASAFSKTGLLYAYCLSRSGSDWNTIYLMNNKGEKLDDVIEWTKFSNISFTHDDKGFFYSSFEKPDVDAGKAGTETAVNHFKRLYYHKIGTPQSEDVLVFLDKENPTYHPDGRVSEDGKYFIITIAKDCDPVNMLYLIDLEEEKQITSDMKLNKIVDNFEGEYSYLTNVGTTFYFQTNLNAPMGKIVKYDLDKPAEGFVEVVPESKDVLDNSQVVSDDKLVLHYIHHVTSKIVVHDLPTGKFIHEIKIPVGTIVSISARREDTELFIQFMSFLTPGTIYRYDFKVEDHEQRLSVFRQAEVKNFDGSLFETKQIFYSSKDGTKVPMFITHKKGLVLDGNNPAFLYSYGGFNISIQPVYSPEMIAFIQHLNGVACYANIRGGGEYGEEWHKGGALKNKQSCFDDFQSAAKYLIQEKYTQPSRLAINGGSNGGLLVSACVNQAPELYGCVVSDVGVQDMLRFQKFTIGHAWQSEFGYSDENKDDFENLLKYSPLHNVRKDHPYPAVALFTSDHDDRVVPLHSFKLAAELQHTAGPVTDKPLVLRIETKAGHGAGKPLTKRIQESTDKFSFIAHSLGAKWVD